jgi:hypothetical protein
VAPERLHTHPAPAMAATPWWIAVGLELVGYCLQRLACSGQCLDAGTDGVVVRALPIARNEPHDQALGLAAADPAHPHAHLLARVVRVYFDALDDRSGYELFCACVSAWPLLPPVMRLRTWWPW